MTARKKPDLLSDPFGERTTLPQRRNWQLLGANFEFESNSRPLIGLADHAFAGLPAHRLATPVPHLKVRLLLRPEERQHSGGVPPAPGMFSGSGLVAAAPGSSTFVVMSAAERAALIAMPRRMLRFPYHTRYEYLEFAAFSLASRAQGLASLHAACVGRAGRAVLLMGDSGAGKSTVTLLGLIAGFEMISEDSVFVAPETMRATGLANFLHVRADTLAWIADTQDAALIRRSPVIRRRSGVRKFEFDLRGGRFRLAPAPLPIAAVVFLSAQRADKRSLLTPLTNARFLTKLRAAQGYAAGQPSWDAFARGVRAGRAFELRRGRHPLDTVEALDTLLQT